MGLEQICLNLTAQPRLYGKYAIFPSPWNRKLCKMSCCNHLNKKNINFWYKWWNNQPKVSIGLTKVISSKTVDNGSIDLWKINQKYPQVTDFSILMRFLEKHLHILTLYRVSNCERIAPKILGTEDGSRPSAPCTASREIKMACVQD